MVMLVFLSRRRRGSHLTSTKRSAVEARVRRALAREGETLRISRGEATRREFGNYWTVDSASGLRLRWRCELEDLARELDVLRHDQAVDG